jgi:protocatechuate 3,4-dioxygenase beta subunit
MFLDLRLAPAPPLYSPGNWPGTTVERVTDADGTLRAKITISLPYYSTIDGKVTNPDGLPMEGCLVELYKELPPGLSERPKNFALLISGTRKEVIPISGLTLITNDQGDYHAARLDPGTYYVREKCSEYGNSRLWRPGYWETFYPEATHIEFAAPITSERESVPRQTSGFP